MTQLGPCWWPDDIIIGLILSIFLIFATPAFVIKRMSKTNNISASNLEPTVSSTGELLAHQVEIVSKLLPLSNIITLKELDRIFREPRQVKIRAIHILFILMAMIACLIMFSAQLWDMAITECTRGSCFSTFEDPGNIFASTWLYGIIHGTSERKLIILISTAVTFFFCTTLLLLMRNTTTIRLVYLKQFKGL